MKNCKKNCLAHNISHHLVHCTGETAQKKLERAQRHNIETLQELETTKAMLVTASSYLCSIIFLFPVQLFIVCTTEKLGKPARAKRENDEIREELVS